MAAKKKAVKKTAGAKQARVRRAAAEPPPRKPGNPRWQRPPRSKVITLASRGLTIQQIADALSVDLRTFQRRRNEDEELRRWVEEGRAKGVKVVANNLFNACEGGNVTAMIFYLKARAGWRDQDAPAAIDPQAVAKHMTEMLSDIDAQHEMEED